MRRLAGCLILLHISMHIRSADRSLKALLSLRCSYRASLGACAAVDALLRIDLILSISLGNSSYRASVRASSAADALIRNFVCHCDFLLLLTISLSKCYYSKVDEKVKR